jgi:hypothetical protein
MSIGISRATLPQEFYDITSDKLLIQPEPQYLYADLMLRALGTSLQMPGSVGLPGRQITGQGSDYTKPEEDRLNLSPDMLSESLFAAKVNFDGQPGTSVRFNRPKYTDSTYTDASRRISPGQTISTTATNVDSEQAVVNLHRYGGPYDNDASEIRPIAVEAFDARMGVHNLVKIKGLHLVRDFHKFLNSQGVALFDAAASTIRPVGMTNDNTPTQKGQFPLDYETISRTARTMDDANAPVLPDGRRVMVVTPTGLKQLKDDPQFASYAKEDNSKNPLFYRYTNLRFVIPEWYIFASNQLTTTANTSSVSIHTAHAIAPEVLGIGMGRAPRIAPNTNDNYGEAVPCVWIADLAFANLDNRLVYKVNYTEDAV